MGKIGVVRGSVMKHQKGEIRAVAVTVSSRQEEEEQMSRIAALVEDLTNATPQDEEQEAGNMKQ